MKSVGRAAHCSTSDAQIAHDSPAVVQSVSAEFLKPDVLLPNAGALKHFPHGLNHAWRTGNVENCGAELGNRLPNHSLVEMSTKAGPAIVVRVWLGDCREHFDLRMLKCPTLKLIQERCILGPAIRAKIEPSRG